MSDAAKPVAPAELQGDLRRSLDAALDPRRADDAALIARVKGRVMTAVRQKSGALHHTVSAEKGLWERVSEGVERKLLWESADAFSCLMRLAPGAVVAGHEHPMDEECVVLEGSLHIGDDVVLHSGDFHVGVKGVAHASAWTETGAVVYLRGARPQGSTAP